jgi:insertion element IS1 protein InsB
MADLLQAVPSGDQQPASFAGLEKNADKLWVWKARDRASGRVVDWECGRRDAATLSRLLERVERWNPRLYCTDDWAAYAELIPQGRLYVGKDQTHGIERDHSRQRHWLARFRRRTCVVSKAKRMVDASIALFVRFGDAAGIGELLSMLA